MPQSSTLTYLAGDHLGSTSLAVDASTGEVIQTRYKPWGEVRYTTPSKTLPTRYTFTGQYSYVSDDATDLGNAGFGLMFYNARWYDPLTGRMAQADSIVPPGVQGLDRFAYVGNNPIVYTDPSGHAQYRSDYQQQIHDKKMKEHNPEPIIVVFCGSYPGHITEPGPACEDQLPAWDYNPWGYEMIFIPYPGSKYEQAQDAIELDIEGPTIVIGYSAGTEPALMFAKSQIESGYDVQQIVLLGPTFSGADTPDAPPGTDIGFDGWSQYMDFALSHGTNIMVVDDSRQRATANEEAAFRYRPPENSKGQYVWMSAFPFEHYDEGGWLHTGVNNSLYVSATIYACIRDIRTCTIP